MYIRPSTKVHVRYANEVSALLLQACSSNDNVGFELYRQRCNDVVIHANNADSSLYARFSNALAREVRTFGVALVSVHTFAGSKPVNLGDEEHIYVVLLDTY